MTSPFSEYTVDKDWQNCDYEIKEQDRFLPIANVGRVMKRALPPQAKVSKESKECMQECVSEFISFITSQASDRCMRENRKTLNGEDILWSMYTLGFENYAETLKIYLAKYRQYEQEQALKNSPKKRKSRVKREVEESPTEAALEDSSVKLMDVSPADAALEDNSVKLNDEIEQLLFQEPSQLTSEDIQEQFTQVYNEGSYFGEDLELSQNQANEKLQNTKTLSSLN